MLEKTNTRHKIIAKIDVKDISIVYTAQNLKLRLAVTLKFFPPDSTSNKYIILSARGAS